MQGLVFKGKLVGKIFGQRYVTERDSTRHYFRKFQGYAISLEILKKLQTLDVKIVEFEIDGINRFQTTVERLFAEGAIWYDGGDLQKIIPVAELVKLPDLWGIVGQPKGKNLPEGNITPDDGLQDSDAGNPAANNQNNRAPFPASDRMV